MSTISIEQNDPNEQDDRYGLAILIRHGQTGDNLPAGDIFVDHEGVERTSKGLVISGHNDVRLTRVGRVQCVEGGVVLAAYLRDIGHDPSKPLRRWCSDLPRTRETRTHYESAMEGFTLLDGDLSFVEWLRERDAGVLQGRLREEARHEVADLDHAFTHADWAYPGGESIATRGRLAGREIAAVMQEGVRVALFFSHEITILGALDYLEGGVERDAVTAHAWGRKGHVKNAGFFVVEFDRLQQRGNVIFHW